MDAEPRVMKPYILITTALVLFAAIGGFFLFVQHRNAGDDAVDPIGAELDAVRTHPVEPPKGLAPADVARLVKFADDAIYAPDGVTRRDAGLALIEQGATAVPFLLDALHLAVTGPLPQGVTLGMRVAPADSVLRRIRLRLTPESPADPMTKLATPTWFMRRAKSWFVWWDDYVATHPELR